jgi:hypothetical protein
MKSLKEVISARENPAIISKEEWQELIKNSTGDSKCLVIPQILISFFQSKKITPLINASIFFSQLMYWIDKGKYFGWIYKSYSEWESEIHLTKNQTELVAVKLEKLGFIERMKSQAYGHPVIHYRITNLFISDFQKCISDFKKCNSEKSEMELLKSEMNVKNQKWEGKNQKCTSENQKWEGKNQKSNTYNTTYNTSYNSQKNTQENTAESGPLSNSLNESGNEKVENPQSSQESFSKGKEKEETNNTPEGKAPVLKFEEQTQQIEHQPAPIKEEVLHSFPPQESFLKGKIKEETKKEEGKAVVHPVQKHPELPEHQPAFSKEIKKINPPQEIFQDSFEKRKASYDKSVKLYKEVKEAINKIIKEKNYKINYEICQEKFGEYYRINNNPTEEEGWLYVINHIDEYEEEWKTNRNNKKIEVPISQDFIPFKERHL